MTNEARNRMNEIIDRVAGGDITTNTDDVIIEHDTVMSPDDAESDESNTETSPPPTKRKKVIGHKAQKMEISDWSNIGLIKFICSHLGVFFPTIRSSKPYIPFIGSVQLSSFPFIELIFHP